MGGITNDGEAVGRVGIIQWDGTPEVRLRLTHSTGGNVIQTLPFNTVVQVINCSASGWSRVTTRSGQMGFVASEYIWTHLPEPGARLHRVEPGLAGTALAIADAYYGELANQWGEDLRFYVNVLAHANRLPVQPGTSGWRKVHFRSETLIWIPSRQYVQGLLDVVNSGSFSHNLASTLGSMALRVAQLWDDLHRAIELSVRYLGEAVTRHVENTLRDIVIGLAEMVVGGVAVLAISTAVGAAIGALAGGVGAVPGAAAGFEVGLVILEWLGLAMLLNWLVESLWKVAEAFAKFFGMVWNARGIEAALERAAREFADAIATLISAILEGLLMLAISRGVSWVVKALRGTAIGRKIGDTQLATWLNRRIDMFRETRAGRPREVLGRLARGVVEARFFRGVQLVQRTKKGKQMELGEFDGIDMAQRMFIENKSARRLHRDNPPKDPVEWADKLIRKHTVDRIQALLHDATGTRESGKGSAEVPTLAEIQGFRRLQFRIDADSPALRAGIAQALNTLRANYPGWIFEVRWGINILLPTLPDWATAGQAHETQ